ncbi:MAG TPA: hypothetical protein ENI23_05385 [bacterium]|nr:hypothetical protein [bacterium]
MSHPSDQVRKIQNRRKSIRQAQAATRIALGELSAPSRERVKQRGLTSTRPIIKTRADVLASATQPSITFSVDKQGKLKTPDILGTARHEVAHFSLPGASVGRNPTLKAGGRQHFALKSAGATGQSLSVQSGAQLRTAESVIKLPVVKQVQRSLQFLNSRTRRKRISQVK